MIPAIQYPIPVHRSGKDPFCNPLETATVTTTVYMIAAPKDESFMDVELMFAEPRDERLQGRQSTAVKLEVKLSESLVAEIQNDATAD